MVIPAAVAVVVAPLLAGCGPTGEQAGRELEPIVVAASPDIQGALVVYAGSGFGLDLTVKAYIPEAESMSGEALAGVVEAGVEAAWLNASEDPMFLRFGVVPNAKPEDASLDQHDVGRFPDMAKFLASEGLTSAGVSSGGSLGFTAEALESYFGPRP